MPDPEIEVKPEPTAEDIAQHRHVRVTTSEKETFEARIAELLEENEKLKSEIEEWKKNGGYPPHMGEAPTPLPDDGDFTPLIRI